MRVLIQQTDGGCFLSHTGAWTANCEEALDFRHSKEALDFCVLNKLKGVQIVLKFSDPVFDIAIPVNEKPRPENRL